MGQLDKLRLEWVQHGSKRDRNRPSWHRSPELVNVSKGSGKLLSPLAVQGKGMPPSRRKKSIVEKVVMRKKSKKTKSMGQNEVCCLEIEINISFVFILFIECTIILYYICLHREQVEGHCLQVWSSNFFQTQVLHLIFICFQQPNQFKYVARS